MRRRAGRHRAHHRQRPAGLPRPGHPCVDNATHNAAGPRPREDCLTVMSRQNAPEPVGTAKLTPGYHLPARCDLHTVGPVADGPVRPPHEHAPAAASRSRPGGLCECLGRSPLTRAPARPRSCHGRLPGVRIRGYRRVDSPKCEWLITHT
ncbi:macro domain-containing protein [Streptomyces sp. NPDC003480]